MCPRIRGVRIDEKERRVGQAVIVDDGRRPAGCFLFSVAYIHIGDIAPYGEGLLIEISEGEICPEVAYIPMVFAYSGSSATDASDDVILHIAISEPPF